MVQAELERNIVKEIDEKPVQKRQETSLASQLSDTVGVLESVISDLRLAQNGNEEDNAMADQLISSLSEIRGNTLRRDPVIIWQNPRIILNGTPVIKSPEQVPVERTVAVARKKTKIQQYYERRSEIISVSELSNIIGVSSSVIIVEAKKLGIELSILGVSSDSYGITHLPIKDAQKLTYHFTKKKFESQVFEGIEGESISIQEMAGIVNTDVGSVLEVSGRLSIPIEKHGHQRLINRKFAKQIKALTEQRAALERLARYSQQQGEDLSDEIDEAAKPRVSTREPRITSLKPRKTEQPALPVTISEFAAKHYLPEAKIVEIARDHFSWDLNDPPEQLSPRQQKLLSFYIESNLRTSLEGFMTVVQICKTLEISSSAWYLLKVTNKISSYRVGGGTFYKKEDVYRVANERQQKANQKTEKRLTRKPQFDKKFEEMMEGNEEQNSRDLDLFGLHLAEIGQIPLEVQKHKLWAVKISNGQLAVRVLENLLNSNLLDSSQKRQIEQILDTSRAKYFSKQFKLLIESKLAKTNKKTEKISPSDKKFFEVLKRHDSWFDRLKANSIPQVVEHQIKLFNFGSEAFDNLVTSNMRLVVVWAKKYLWSRLPISDLKSYGDEGLMKAAARFDWRRDTKFSTYATLWITQSIRRGIADYSDTIRVPVHMYERISKFKREADELLQKGEDIDMEELANKVDPTGNLAKSLNTRNLVSLNSAVGPDQDSFLEDFLEDVRNNIEESSDKIGMREALMEALDALMPRERKVLMLRYGLEDGRSMSLDQVAACLAEEGFAKVTRERIRQIESKALLKLRHPSRSKKLRPYLDDDPRSIEINPGQAANVPRSNKKMPAYS